MGPGYQGRRAHLRSKKRPTVSDTSDASKSDNMRAGKVHWI